MKFLSEVTILFFLLLPLKKKKKEGEVSQLWLPKLTELLRFKGIDSKG